MRIAVLVTNDLVHDQRVRKTCEVLIDYGLDITLVGRKFEDSAPIERSYEIVRFENMRYKRGAKFYAEINLKLYRWLRDRQDIDAIWANDLDTLWPAFAIARKRNLPLIYDSHEYFTEAAGLTGRPFPKWVWQQIERRIFPKLQHVITVNESIARIYREKYRVAVHVVRNIPKSSAPLNGVTRSSLGLPAGGKLLVLQGAFMDKDRGVVDAVHAMEYLPDEVRLLLIGAGEEWEAARLLASERQLENRVLLLPKQPYETLRKYTSVADAGLTLDKGVHFNYYYSLPNKLFDYIHARVPVVASPLPEVQSIVTEFGVGAVIEDWSPEQIAKAVLTVLEQGKDHYAEALERAAHSLTWEIESQTIRNVLDAALGEVK